MNKKKLGKYFFFSEIRISNIINYLKEKKISSSFLFESSNNESSIHYLLGILIQNNIKKINTQDIIELSMNESQFRNELVKSMKNQKSNEIQKIMKKYNISESNIKYQENSKNIDSFQAIKFLEYLVKSQDSNLVEILKKREILDSKSLKEMIKPAK